MSIIIVNSFTITPKKKYFQLALLQKMLYVPKKKKKEVTFRKLQKAYIAKPVLKLFNTKKLIRIKKSNYMEIREIFNYSILKANKNRLLLAKKYKLSIIIYIMRDD